MNYRYDQYLMIAKDAGTKIFRKRRVRNDLSRKAFDR